MLARLRSPGAALVVPVAACLAVAAILFAAASSSDDPQAAAPVATAVPTPTPAATLLTEAQVLANRRGTPGHAAVAFWQAAQFRDVDAAFALLSDRVRRDVGRDRLGRLLSDAAGPLNRLPRVTTVTREGSRTRVRMALTDARGAQAGGATLVLVDEGGWRVDDLFYLEAVAAAADAPGAP